MPHRGKRARSKGGENGDGQGGGGGGVGGALRIVKPAAPRALQPAAPPVPQPPAPSEAPTPHVLVLGLQRPFSVPSFKALVVEAATRAGSEAFAPDSIFLNEIRTFALFSLASAEAATKAVGELEGKVWPPGGTMTLKLGYSSVSPAEYSASVEAERALHLQRQQEAAAAAQDADTEADEEDEWRGGEGAQEDAAQALDGGAGSAEEAQGGREGGEREGGGSGSGGGGGGDAAAAAALQREKRLGVLARAAAEKCARTGRAVASEAARAFLAAGRGKAHRDRPAQAGSWPLFCGVANVPLFFYPDSSALPHAPLWVLFYSCLSLNTLAHPSHPPLFFADVLALDLHYHRTAATPRLCWIPPPPLTPAHESSIRRDLELFRANPPPPRHMGGAHYHQQPYPPGPPPYRGPQEGEWSGGGGGGGGRPFR